jgi:hypothetical protein
VVGWGWIVRSAQVRRDAVAAITRAGGWVDYDFQRLRSSTRGGYDNELEPPWPRGLVRHLGVDYFGHVERVGFLGSDAELDQVRRLGRLEQLLIDERSSVTDAGLRRIRGLKGLRSLGLKGTRVTDAGLECLGGLTGLERLDLGDTAIGDAGLAHLRGLTGIQFLSLRGTRITDAGLEDVGDLTRLESLVLAETRVTDSGLRHLKRLAGLRVLKLWETGATDAGVRELRRTLPNLTIVR